jgi:excinuclease ABC subunit C
MGFKKEMVTLSEALEFEKAQLLKDKIQTLENYQYKSTIVSPSISDVDVFSFVQEDRHIYINFLQISFGSIVRSYNLEIKIKIEEGIKKILELVVVELRLKFNSISPEIFSPIMIDVGENIKVTIPKIGDKKKILNLSLKNAIQFKFDSLKQLKILDPERHQNRILNQLKIDLDLPEIPIHIECFDNSNIQGTNPTSACVVFKNAKPSKKDYRHFNIKSVKGPDDYASMEEVVYRRYNRLLKENSSMPQLIIIDGGKGQLSAAMKSLIKLNIQNRVKIIGIAKRLEEIYFPYDSTPLFLDKKSESLIIIQKLRNEAHRFSLQLHRNKRSKSSLSNELDSINGIGESTTIKLLKTFKSNKLISKASLDDLKECIGLAKAKIIFDYYNKKNNN